MDLSRKNHFFEISFIFLALIIFTAIFMLFPVKIFSIYFIFLVFFIIALFLLNNKLGFFLIILTRPLLDSLTNFNIINIDSFYFNISAIFAIFVISLTFLIYAKNRQKISLPNLNYFWWVFLAIAFISIPFSYDKVASLTEWVRLLSIYSFFFLGFLLIKNKDDFFRLLKVVVYSALVPSFFAIYQFITNSGMTIPLEGITNRIYGTFAHPNLFAYYLVFMLVLLTYLISKKKNLLSNSILFTLYSILLILTFTRGAWLALILVFFIIGAVKFRKMLITLFLLLIIIYLAVEPIRLRVNALREYNPDSSIEWRKGIWNDGLSIAKEKIIQGHGTGTAHEILLEARGEEAGSPDPHNDYLKLFIENGAIGIISYVFLILALLYTIIRKYFSSKEFYQKDLYLILFSFSVVIFTLSFVDNILRNTILQWTFWVIISSALITYKK